MVLRQKSIFSFRRRSRRDTPDAYREAGLCIYLSCLPVEIPRFTSTKKIVGKCVRILNREAGMCRLHVNSFILSFIRCQSLNVIGPRLSAQPSLVCFETFLSL